MPLGLQRDPRPDGPAKAAAPPDRILILSRTVPGSKPGRAGRRGTRGSFRQLPHLLLEFHHPQGVRPAVQSLKPSMTRLTRLREEEAENLRSQIATGSIA